MAGRTPKSSSTIIGRLFVDGWRLAPLYVLLALVLLSCSSKHTPVDHQPAFSYFRSPELEEVPVRRVVLMPLENVTHYPYAHELFRDAFATQLRAANLFEVVVLPEEVAAPWVHSVSIHGRFHEQTLAEMTQKYNADGVIFGSLTDYHPYWPPRAGIVLHLVGTHQATTLASVDGVWDARHASVAHQAEHYYRQLTPDETMPHRDLILNSPRYFSSFVAAQVVHAISDRWQPNPEHKHHPELKYKIKGPNIFW